MFLRGWSLLSNVRGLVLDASHRGPWELCTGDTALHFNKNFRWAVKTLFFLHHTFGHFYHFEVYHSVAFSTFTMSCNHQGFLVPELSITPKGNSVSSCFLLPLHPAHEAVISYYPFTPLPMSMDLPILDISYKLNHRICDLCVWLEIPLLGIYPKEPKMCSNTCARMLIAVPFTTASRWKTQMSISWRMENQNVVGSHDGLQFNHREEGRTDCTTKTCWEPQLKWIGYERPRSVWFHVQAPSYTFQRSTPWPKTCCFRRSRFPNPQMTGTNLGGPIVSITTKTSSTTQLYRRK